MIFPNKPTIYLRLEVLFGFMLVLTACNSASAPVGELTSPAVAIQIFEGFYEVANDVSSFVPCAMNELPGPGKGHWLIPNNEFSRLYEHPQGITIGDIAGTYGPGDKFATYVRFEGILSSAVDNPGQGYGHLGLYAREITVTKALEAKRLWVETANTEPDAHRKLCP